jgi:hypothetical protein
LTRRSPSIFTTEAHGVPHGLAGTLRNDGVEDVADVALAAVVTHARTLSAPHRIALAARNRIAWGYVPPDPIK